MRILLGVTGGIAACKAPELVRRLRERGHEVRCALTRAGAAFVSPLTLEVLSGREVFQEDYLAPGHDGEEAHITAAQWADALCVAPATAHVLARLALGLADDFLTTTALACRGPIVLAPAMHHAMWTHPAVQANVAALSRRGARFVGPGHGRLASGETGWGRMAEPEEIVAALEALKPDSSLSGKRVVVSAGPTHEPIDAVRFLANRSSGKMGFALATEAARRGARVTLVAGPVELATPAGVERIDVETAHEMEEAVHGAAPSADLVILAAAVADFRPRRAAEGKIKKEAFGPALELELNPDILAGVAELAPHAVRVGFAAETAHVERTAAEKLRQKRVQFLVANDVSRSDIAFGSDSNEVTVYREHGDPLFLSRRPKAALAADLIDLFAEALSRRERQPADTSR
ncbi:MAG: bifunctional phosphopantothenoylcysteine decarboxylase/phosphopantothenate--cysteine ligase CoaBC [Acidobacteriota bacterium]